METSREGEGIGRRWKGVGRDRQRCNSGGIFKIDKQQRKKNNLKKFKEKNIKKENTMLQVDTLALENYVSFATAILSRNHRGINITESISVSTKS